MLSRTILRVLRPITGFALILGFGDAQYRRNEPAGQHRGLFEARVRGR
jgi:hypothetical protein